MYNMGYQENYYVVVGTDIRIFLTGGPGFGCTGFEKRRRGPWKVYIIGPKSVLDPEVPIPRISEPPGYPQGVPSGPKPFYSL